MKIGLYFGSFNPIHLGHLIIASHIANLGIVDQVWFVVSPQNPLKDAGSLLNEYQRLHLVHLAIEDDIRFKTCDVEFKLPKPSYTIDTLSYLSEKYPQNKFSIILGSDSFNNLSKWKNAEVLLKHYKFLVYIRNGYSLDTKDNNHVTIIDAPILNISATHIRNNIKLKKSIRYLVSEKVRVEIENNHYYK